jgi:hypothetical protein
VGIKTCSAFGGHVYNFVYNGAFALVIGSSDKIAGKWNADF